MSGDKKQGPVMGDVVPWMPLPIYCTIKSHDHFWPDKLDNI